MPEDPDALRATLRRQRERAGLSLAQLSAATGLSKSYLVRLETQPSNPSLSVLDRIGSALGVTVADLLGTPPLTDEGGHPELPESLRRFAAEDGLGPSELRTLASIRFRRGEEPRTVERWRYIWTSLEVSRSLDGDSR